MAIHLNDNGFEQVSTYSLDEFAQELRRRPPSRWIGKTALEVERLVRY